MKTVLVCGAGVDKSEGIDMSYQAKFTDWQNLSLEDLKVAYRKAKPKPGKNNYTQL
ncbi:MAG: forkhead box transcription factor [Methylococcaceae bacterium]|jgi:hypothetical protein|nr:forkhead box transcription factor [Methylococcaceae bacterium]